MRIPEVRDRLLALAAKLDEPHRSELLTLIEQLRRRKSLTKVRQAFPAHYQRGDSVAIAGHLGPRQRDAARAP